MGSSRPVQPGLRTFQSLKWIYGLNDRLGARRGQEIQWATATNLTAYYLEHDAYRDLLLNRFSRRSVRRGKDRVFKVLQSRVASDITRLDGKGYLERLEPKIEKTPENHLAVRERYVEDSSKVTRYELSSTGENKMEALRELFDEKSNVTSSDGKYAVDSIKIPVEGRTKWGVDKYKVPRVWLENGRVVGKLTETGRLERVE